jgi:hypothetical protein
MELRINMLPAIKSTREMATWAATRISRSLRRRMGEDAVLAFTAEESAERELSSVDVYRRLPPLRCYVKGTIRRFLDSTFLCGILGFELANSPALFNHGGESLGERARLPGDCRGFKRLSSLGANKGEALIELPIVHSSSDAPE